MRKMVIINWFSPALWAVMIVFLIGGIAVLLGGYTFGWFAIAFAGVGLLYNDGTEISFAKNRVREFWAFGPFRVGVWRTIHPECDTRIRKVNMKYSRQTPSMMHLHDFKYSELKLELKQENGSYVLVKLDNSLSKLEKLEMTLREGLAPTRVSS